MIGRHHQMQLLSVARRTFLRINPGRSIGVVPNPNLDEVRIRTGNWVMLGVLSDLKAERLTQYPVWMHTVSSELKIGVTP